MRLTITCKGESVDLMDGLVVLPRFFSMATGLRNHGARCATPRPLMPGDPEAALDQGPMDATGERFQDRHTADEPEVSRCICSSLTIWCISRTSFCLYDLGFQSLRQREFVSLALLGEWKSAEPGERVVTEGKSVSASASRSPEAQRSASTAIESGR